mmetsp:Transcript_30365/g.29726  ORF Transcript_30365/g.29726 Transcript_30365/m.29726 type:complete len:186 (-) Transcript_30365:3297-3854(-)
MVMLKRGCRDRMKLVRVVSCELMFKLLHTLALQRNQFAPLLYKSLTFILIEFHLDEQIREQMLKHFMTIFQLLPSIPVTILCEPLIKQIQINDSHLTNFQFNTFDFDFFKAVINHKRVSANLAMQIADEMAYVAQGDIFFRNCAVDLMLRIIYKFNKDHTMHSGFSKMFKDSFEVLEVMEQQRIA